MGQIGAARRTAVSFVVGGLAALGVWWVPAAEASCAAPNVAASPSQAPQGSSITISGDGYWDRCNDVITCYPYTPSPTPGSPSPTPTQSCTPTEPEQPIQNITIKFVQGDRSWTLGTVDADSNGSFELTAKVPAGAAFGSAKIRTCYPTCEWSTTFKVGALATTGRDLRVPLAAGVAALVAGLALRAVTRTPRRSAL
jgi:hypothetical protein